MSLNGNNRNNRQVSPVAAAGEARRVSRLTKLGARKGRRGTVLLMVVAILAALFVLAVTMLSAVSNEDETIDSAVAARKSDNVVSGIIADIKNALRVTFIGKDGKAYNIDIPLANGFAVDRYGEQAGNSPLLASIEPYASSIYGDTRYFDFTDLERFLAGKPAANEPVYYPLVVDVALRQGAAPGLPIEYHQIGSVADPDNNLNFDDSVTFRRSADGSGVFDSLEFRLPYERFPLAMRGHLPEQLRLNSLAYQTGTNLTPDDLFYALRLVGHSGLVNLNHSHRVMLEAVLGPTETGAFTMAGLGGYVPQIEETYLRNRGLLPTQRLPFSFLQDPLSTVIPASLYVPFDQGGVYRWWPLSTGMANGDMNATYEEITTLFRDQWVNPEDMTNYDRRHLITTVSYDDQLMRLGRSTTTPEFDWIEQIQDDDPPADPFDGDFGDFAIDQWPHKWPQTPPYDITPSLLPGRLKVSLPGLEEVILVGSGLYPLGTGIDALAAAASSQELTVRSRFIATIQDAFMLMLRDVEDFNADGMPNVADDELRWKTAAALTANFVDYADANLPGSNKVPTPVEIVNDAGVPQGTFVYGLERQPYISEVVALVTATDPTTNNVFAVELHNPYNDNNLRLQQGPLDPPGSEYRLEVGGTQYQLTGDVLARDANPCSGSFRMIGKSGNSGITFDQPEDLMTFNPGATIRLIRRTAYPNLPPPGYVDIVVDEVKVPGDFPDPTISTEEKVASYQRDTRFNEWMVVVPVYDQQDWEGDTIDPADLVRINATLGCTNEDASGNELDLSSQAKPFHLDFADSGQLESAFPTTGSLLLLSRYANEDSAVPGSMPANANLVLAASGAKPLQIDNGRMPIFDETQRVVKTAPAGTFDEANIELRIPWGQLVFDYFTALPLDYDRADFDDPTPTVDLGGLRVHGRIDLNTAPWKVLSGLPLLIDQLDNLPADYRSKIIGTILDGAVPAGTPAPISIGEELARAIVAYREGREIIVGGVSSGDYGQGVGIFHGNNRARLPVGSSGYTKPGSGFLSVGELANVRPIIDDLATVLPIYRIDWGMNAIPAPPPSDLQPPGLNLGTAPDFVRAAARLIALGDWVTTRSHVFTIYGTVRGSGDNLVGVNQKAIRFQETVDRLPTVLGQPLPVTVGTPVVESYADAVAN